VLFERVFPLTAGKMFKFSENNISLQISTDSKKIIFKLFKLFALSIVLTRTDISLFVVRGITPIKTNKTYNFTIKSGICKIVNL